MRVEQASRFTMAIYVLERFLTLDCTMKQPNVLLCFVVMIDKLIGRELNFPLDANLNLQLLSLKKIGIM